MYFLNRGTPGVLQTLPSLPPFLPLLGEDLPLWAARYSNACTDGVCFVLLIAEAVLSAGFPCHAHLYRNHPQPTKLHVSWLPLCSWPPAQHGRSRNRWGNPPLAREDHFFSAVWPRWPWQSSCAGTATGMKVGAIHMPLESVGTPAAPWLRWALGSRLKVCCFLSASPCGSGGVSLSETQRRPENSLVHTAWSRFGVVCFHLELILCTTTTSTCLLRHLWTLLTL